MESNEKEKKIRPQDKWDAKAGVISKTYKVNKSNLQSVWNSNGHAANPNDEGIYRTAEGTLGIIRVSFLFKNN